MSKRPRSSSTLWRSLPILAKGETEIDCAVQTPPEGLSQCEGSAEECSGVETRMLGCLDAWILSILWRSLPNLAKG